MPRAAATLLLALALVSCGSGGTPDATGFPPSGVRVLLVGIDGATFKVLQPLAAAGRLPTLAGLMARGSSAPLRSLDPSRSPAIWTTVATGHLPATHGIEGFTSREGGTREQPKLVTTRDRRVLSLWNIASATGRSVDVGGWWVTWPAEPVNGRLVSDRVAHTRWESWTGDRAERYLTSPAALYAEIRELVLDPAELDTSEIEKLAPLSQEERRELADAREPIPFHWPSVIKFGWAEQRSYEKIALHLLAGGQPDLALVFLIAVDPASHTTWHYYEPESFEGVDPADAKRLGNLIPNLYEHDDAVLARLLEQVDQDTVVLVVSDHGFRASGELPGSTDRIDLRPLGIEREQSLERPVNVGMSGVHTRNGILIAAGGPIVGGAHFDPQPGVADITPTVLALLGLPVGEDMDGRVLREMIDPDFLARHPVQRISSWEDTVDRPTLPGPEDDPGTRTEYLRALGYIE